MWKCNKNGIKNIQKLYLPLNFAQLWRNLCLHETATGAIAITFVIVVVPVLDQSRHHLAAVALLVVAATAAVVLHEVAG